MFKTVERTPSEKVEVFVLMMTAAHRLDYRDHDPRST